MANTRAGVHVVVAKAGPDELLDQVGFLVAATGRGDSTDRVPPVLGLDPLQLTCPVVDGLLPRDFAPRVADLRAKHRLQHAMRMSGIADREPAFHAGVAMVRMTVL